jgi:hypothetical protein
LTNNTLYDNLAGNGGGIFTDGGTNTLTNNIFWQNKRGADASTAGADYYEIGINGSTFKNNLLQLASSNYTTTGNGNYDLGTAASGNLFAQDPLFVSTTVGAIDLRLQATSPCVNAGISGVGIPTTDITGATRTGNPDLGAYEYVVACITPTAYTVTGGGGYCAGGAGVAIGLANSETDVTYQLKRGATDVGTAQGGTAGQPISFGNQTAAGTYTVVATRTSDGCTVNMTGSVDVTVNALPTVSITGANPICVGATTTVGTGNGGGSGSGSGSGSGGGIFVGSSPAVSNPWTSSNNTVATVNSSGVVTGVSAGTATFTFTQASTGCTSLPTLAVTINAKPVASINRSNATVCAGVGITLSNQSAQQTSAGNSVSVTPTFSWAVTSGGSFTSTTGSPVTWSSTTSGQYSVTLTVNNGSCTNTASTTVSVNALPTAFTVTGGGDACPGSTGVGIVLNGSLAGVSYQLKRGATNVGNPVPGTGSSLNFGNFSTAGTYTVEATNATSCAATMNGSATVGTPNPASAGIAANQTICVGTTPANISLSALVGSVVKWQRATNANFTDATDISVASSTLTGSSIGALSVDTWIRAVIQNGTCPAINTSAVRISILTSFTAEATSNASLICSNQTLRLTATPNQAGLTYNWRGPATFGSTLQSPTRTGLTTAMSGVYSVTITRPACNASGSATVSVVVSPSGSAFAPQMTALTFNNTAPNAQTNTVGVCAGSALTLNITANQHTLTYNWRGPAGGSGSGFLSAPVNGVTNASAQISAAVAANQQGQYTVTVRNGCNVSNHRVINLQVRNCTSTRLAAAEDERTLGLNINLAPNPVRDFLTASFEGVEGQTIQIQLIDAQGRSRQQATIEAAEGKAQLRFDLRSLPAGMYLLQAETETQRAVKKVIKL